MQSREKHRKINNMRKQTFLLIFIMLLFAGKAGAQCVTVGSDLSICQGGSTGPLGGLYGNDATGAVWSSNVGGTFTDNTGSTPGITTWTPPSAYNGTAILTLTAVGGTCDGSSLSISITVAPSVPVSVTIAASPSSTICAGTLVTFTATPTNGGTPTYQWKVNATSVGTNSPTYTSTTLSNGDVVTVVMTSSLSCTTGNPDISNPITMTVSTSLPVSVTIAASPSSTICAGTLVTFTATPTNGGTTPSYQWKVNGSNVGTNSSTHSYIPANGDVIICVLTSNASCATGNPATSNTLTMVVNPLLLASVSIAVSPSGTICAGTSVTFTATPTNGGTPTYQWKVNGSNVGTNSPIFTSTTLTNTEVVTVVMTSSAICASGSPATSNAITMAVNPSVPVSVSITASPSGAICAGTSVIFTATPTNGGTPTYQWKINGSNVGTNSPTFTSTTFSNSDMITVVMTSSATCATGSPATSNLITMSVNPIPTPTLSSSAPGNVSCQGTSVTFTAGGGTNYDFRVGGVTVQNSLLTTYTTTSLADGQIVNVIVTNNVTGCSAISTDIHNIVHSLPYIVVTTPTTCSTDYLTYSVGVTVTPGATVTCTSGLVTNIGTNVWTITGILAHTNVSIIVTDSNGCINTLPVTAPDCNCPVVLPPVSGGDKSYCASGVIPAINATVLTGETVDWYNSSSGGTLLKSGSLSYTPTAPGTYYALARNTTSNCVSSTRTPVTVTMNPLPIPTLTSSDPDNIFCAGTSVIFTATGGTNYNFLVEGSSVQNGVSATYTTSTLTNGQRVNVIVTNANGCTATAAQIINTVNPTPTPTLTSSDADNSFCAGTSITFTAGGGSAYDFMVGGVSVQSGVSATYTTNTLTNGQVVNVVVSNANGCTATSSGITNTVNALPMPTITSSDADNIFCAGTSVTFTATGGTTYNFRVAGVIVQNGTSATYTTNSLTNGQIVDVIAANSTGCNVTSSGITNTVNPQPTANAGTGGTVCNLNFNFNAVPSIGIGTWTKTSGPGTATYAPNANTANAAVTVSEYGTYSFTWTEVSGQCSSSSTITVNFNLQPVANPGTGGNNCGLGFHFNGSLNIGIGTWTKVNGPGNVSFSPDANTANALVTVTAFGTYTFSWTVVNGTCSNSANVTVVFIQQLAANAGSGGSECDKNFILNAVVTTTGTGTWAKAAGPGNAVFTPDNHLPNATVTVDQFGTYDFAWTVVNATCTSSDIIRVTFHDLPSVNAGRDTAMCKGSSIQLHALGTGSISWVPIAFVSNPNIINPIATPDTTTTFTVNLTDQFGCKNSDNIVVEVREKLTADAGPDQVLGYLFTTVMGAKLAHSYENGVWSVISGTGNFLDSTYAQTSVKDLSLGINTFLWTVTNGFCPPARDTALITVNDFVIPTLITPNMDGRNDYFVLRGLATLGKTELVIFNRRGAQVYRNLNYDNSWNGVDYNKNPLPDDTYFYVIKSANGKSISGYIVIRR